MTENNVTPISPTDAAFQTLAADVDRASDKFEPGTVLRWNVGRRWTYAALKAGRRWHITGTTSRYQHGGVSYETLTRYLSSPDVTDIQASTEWSLKAKSGAQQDFASPPSTGGFFVVAMPDGTLGDYDETDEAAWDRGFDPSSHG